VADLAESIREESLASEALMSRFLSFAKPLNLSPEPIDIGELLDSALTMLTHPGLKAIKITKSLPGDLPSFRGDRMLLRQVILNLLLNACDALPAGGEIRVKAALEGEYERGAPREIALSVTDNGVGISPEISTRIFDPFVTGKPDGTGLGLALVKKIVVMHGGRVEARSKPGKGTRFAIYIPLEPTKIPVAESATASL
jgi:signal transduction histidine kinase